MGKQGKRLMVLAVAVLLVSIWQIWQPGAALGETIGAARIRALIKDHVDRLMPWEAGRVRMDFLTRVSDLEFPQGSIKMRVEGRGAGDYLGETAFTVKFYDRDTLIREETIRVGLEVLVDFVVSARALPGNRVIAEDDVRVLKKWVKRIPVNAVNGTADVVGKMLKINVRQNTELTRNMLKTPMLVKRGNVVNIVLDMGSLTISTLGVAQEAGGEDKVIRVRNLSSNRIIYARVTGDSLVTVDY